MGFHEPDNEFEQTLDTFEFHNSRARGEMASYFDSKLILGAMMVWHQVEPLDLANDPSWVEIEAEWDKARQGSENFCNITKVKRMMLAYVENMPKL